MIWGLLLKTEMVIFLRIQRIILAKKSNDASVKSTVLLAEVHADLNPDAGFVRNIKGIGKGLFGILKSFESNYHNGDYDKAITTAKNITKKVATGIVEQGLNSIEHNAKIILTSKTQTEHLI